jgi:Zn-dependent protease
MGTSLTLFRIKGIDVRVHWSFLLILAYGAFLYSGGPAGVLAGAIYGIITILLLFVCVTLHEFGHAFVAQHYDIHVKSIMLLPIGGVANLERVPEKPIQEFLIAIAGPLVNFALAAILFPIVLFSAGMQIRSGDVSGVRELLANVQTPGLVNLLVYLLLMNLLLALFNLLPAFPMDGGRILRSLLAMTMNYVQATRAAVTVGRFVAVLLALWGIFLWSTGGGGIILLLVAFFVYVGGGAEREAVESRAVLRNYTASQALTPGAKNFYVTDQLSKAAEQLMVSYQTDYPVIDLSGKFAGVLTRSALIRALQTLGADARIVDAMTPAPDVPVCNPTTDLASLWEKLATSGQRVVAVKDGEEFLGLITIDDITEVVHVMGAAAAGKNKAPALKPSTGADGQSADA